MSDRTSDARRSWFWFFVGVGSLVLVALAVLQSNSAGRPAAWGGLPLLVVLGYSVSCFIRWWRGLRHPVLSRGTKRIVFISWNVAGGVAIATGAFLNGSDGTPPTVGAGFLLVGMAAIIGSWTLRFGIAWGRALGADLDAALTPVPSPIEIAHLLEDEWGRRPTIEEVAAVHQMLISRKNQALISSGASLGALYLMSHGDHH